MNLYRIINDIKSTCMSHRDVQDFHYGDIYDYENTKSLKYINTNFTLQNISSGLEGDTKTMNGVLFCVDRLTDNGDNKLIAQSRCTDILQSIINRLTENYSGWSIENTVYEVFSTKFADLCAGCFCTFSLSVDEDSVCSDDEFIVKSKEIKGNGIYDVIGYDRIIVDVQPKLKEIEIVKNGVYLPEKDSDGYNKIAVNVPPKKSVINAEQIKFSNASVIDDNIEIVGLKSCYQMFYNCFNLTSVPLFDTSNVTSMLMMFYNCYNLTSIYQLDTSKVTDMSQMFYSCYNLTSIPQMNTSKVTNMNNMFSNCKKITTIHQLDTSKVTNMGWMFNYCEELTSVPLFDMSNVDYIIGMFLSCGKLTDLGGLTNIGKVFKYAETLDLSYSPLTNQSVQNIIDTVFDMNQNTQGGTAYLKLSQTVIDAMTDEQKSQLAAKGWTLTN